MTFTRRPGDKPPAATHPPMTQLNCPIFNADGSPTPKGTPVYIELVVDDPALDQDVRYGGIIVDPGSLVIKWPGCAPKGQGAWMTVSIQGQSWKGRIITPIDPPYTQMGTGGGESEVRLSPSSATPFKRPGVVRAQGRCLADDLGTFHPLGGTLFWAPRGWREDRDRLIQNLKYLSAAGFDYYRILCAVDWAGEEIRPDWPDYEQVMAELIDYAYDTLGLRCEPTLYGGGDWNVVGIADTMVRVAQGRFHKILHWEISNEAYQNGPDLAAMQEAAAVLRDGSPNLIALSAPLDASPGTAEDELANGADTCTIHFDRTWADGGWRTTRQGWDFKELLEHPGSSNEPAGPGSSVAEEWNPLHLAMMRATGILVGGSAYILHNSSGIYGTSDPGRHRTANLWEMVDPDGHGWNADVINQAVRNIDTLLPADVENWAPVNDGWAAPLLPIWCIEWNEDSGPVKHYGAVQGADWVSMPHGIKNRFVFQAQVETSWTAFDPLTLAIVGTGHLKAGDIAELPGAAVVGDEQMDRQCAYIIKGSTTVGVDLAAGQDRKRDRRRDRANS